MKLVPALTLALIGSMFGCRSSAPDPAPEATATAACTCGQPMADFEGCAHPLCLQGLRNPDNPDCVCGPLELSEQGAGR